MRGCNHVYSTANKTQRDQTEAKQPNGSSGGFSPGTNAAFTQFSSSKTPVRRSKTPCFHSAFAVSTSLVNLLQISEEPIHEFQV